MKIKYCIILLQLIICWILSAQNRISMAYGDPNIKTRLRITEDKIKGAKPTHILDDEKIVFVLKSKLDSLNSATPEDMILQDFRVYVKLESESVFQEFWISSSRYILYNGKSYKDSFRILEYIQKNIVNKPK